MLEEKEILEEAEVLASDQETAEQTAETETEAASAAEAKLTAELEELNQRFLRVAADFDNYKRRTNLEKEDLIKYSTSKLVGELLPVIDNFELALKNADGSAEVQGFLKGVEMIYNQLMETLGKAGLAKIEAVGQPFDPNMHEAIMQVPDDSVPEDTVVEDLRTGYMFKEKCLRPTMCKVSN